MYTCNIMTNQHVCYIHTLIYIRAKAIHLIRVHNLHFITTTALYILHIMCFPLVSATWFPLYKKTRNDLPLCSSAHLMPPLHFLCSRRRKGQLPFKENTFMLRCFKLFPFFAHLSPQTPKSRIHIHYIYPTPSKNYMFFCRNNRNKDNISGRYV